MLPYLAHFRVKHRVNVSSCSKVSVNQKLPNSVSLLKFLKVWLDTFRAYQQGPKPDGSPDHGWLCREEPSWDGGERPVDIGSMGDRLDI